MPESMTRAKALKDLCRLKELDAELQKFKRYGPLDFLEAAQEQIQRNAKTLAKIERWLKENPAPTVGEKVI